MFASTNFIEIPPKYYDQPQSISQFSDMSNIVIEKSGLSFSSENGDQQIFPDTQTQNLICSPTEQVPFKQDDESLSKSSSNSMITTLTNTFPPYSSVQNICTPKQNKLQPTNKQLCMGISTSQVVQLLQQKENNDFDIEERQLMTLQSLIEQNIMLIDCRWPYEYNGGTIKGSINIYDANDLQKILFEQKLQQQTILVFYCEFSQVRARKLSNYAFKLNQQYNYYDQIYVMQGGYHEFFEKYKEYTTTYQYIQEGDAQYMSQMNIFNNNGKYYMGLKDQ